MCCGPVSLVWLVIHLSFDYGGKDAQSVNYPMVYEVCRYEILVIQRDTVLE